MQLNASMTTEISKWKELLQRIIDVVLFLGERGLSFRGDTHVIGDVHNGNFLGIIELISHYDPVLREHVTKVQESQKEGNVYRPITFLRILKMNLSIYAQIKFTVAS